MKTAEERQDLQSDAKSETKPQLAIVDELAKLTQVIIVILLCPLYWTFIAVVFVTFLLPCLLYRFIVIKACAYFHPTWVPLSVRDNFLGEDFITTKPNSMLTVLITLNDPLPLDEYRKKYNETFVQLKDLKTGEYPMAKYMQYHERWMGYHFWKWDEEFKIENHIRILEGTKGNEFTTEEQLMELLGTSLTAGLKPKRPHWEVLVAENFIPKDSETPNVKKAAYVFRIHHGMADGYSLLKSYVEHLCQEKNMKDKIVVPKFDVAKVNPIVKLWNGFYAFASIPHVLGMQNLIDIDSNIWFKREEKLTRNSLAGRSKRIPVEDIKAIRRKYGVSFNTVLYAILAGGIRKYFRRKYLNDNKVGVPDFIRSFAPFPWKNHPNNKIVNHWTCAIVPVLTGVECPIERLYKTEAEFNKVKSSAAPLANYLSISLCGWPPAWFVKTFGKNTFSTAIVSIFPGPTQRLKFFGENVVDDESFWAPHLRGNAGIGVGICSYKESVRVAISVDTAIMNKQRDLEELLKYIEEEVDVLLLHSGLREEEKSESIITPQFERIHNGIEHGEEIVCNNNDERYFDNSSLRTRNFQKSSNDIANAS